MSSTSATASAFAPAALDPWARRHQARWDRIIAKFDAMRETTLDESWVFTGSSTIRRWENLAEDFPALTVCNRGLAAARATDMLAFYDRIIAPLRPRNIVLYAGVNEIINGQPVAQAVQAVQTLIIHALDRIGPGKLYLLPLLPHPKFQRKHALFAQANAALEPFAAATPRAKWVKIDDNLHGAPYSEDRVHLAPEGYTMLARRVRDAVAADLSPGAHS